ncbi:MAG: hypothetical protein IPO88_01135 [Nannocystis sp.]|uniref:hypothetical protein n=1 Tax=Nannocystis sp. TaxID=1962667 RepID=UPI002428A805|nr:hypothetical protein [Nannocystis sp.]MBK9752106.1 hypothetical protein [Nannocystis sp.]
MSISMEHAALVEMFRSNPGLVPQLLRDSFAVVLPAWETVSIAEAELDQLAPIEFRADLVVELAGAGAPRLGAVVEVQLSADDDKRFSWPVYLTVNRAPAVGGPGLADRSASGRTTKCVCTCSDPPRSPRSSTQASV